MSVLQWISQSWKKKNASHVKSRFRNCPKFLIDSNIFSVFPDLQTVRETGDEAKGDRQDVDDDYAEDEDIVDVHMPKGGVAKGGGRSKGKKKNRGGRARDKPSRVRQS